MKNYVMWCGLDYSQGSVPFESQYLDKYYPWNTMEWKQNFLLCLEELWCECSFLANDFENVPLSTGSINLGLCVNFNKSNCGLCAAGLEWGHEVIHTELSKGRNPLKRVITKMVFTITTVIIPHSPIKFLVHHSSWSSWSLNKLKRAIVVYYCIIEVWPLILFVFNSYYLWAKKNNIHICMRSSELFPIRKVSKT